MPRRILYLTYDGLTDQLGRSQIIPYIIGLSKKQFQITIISFEKQAKKSAIDSIKVSIGADIMWHSLSYTKYPPVISTAWDVYRLHKKVKALHNEFHFSLIHCRSYITSIIGLFMKRKHQVPFLFDMRGFWPDERLDGNLWNLRNPLFYLIYKYFKLKEQQFLTEAEHIISLTKKGKLAIENEMVENPAPISVIPCCVDTNLFNIQNRNSDIYRKKLNIPSHTLVLGYVGSIGTWYCLPEMVKYFKVLLSKKPDSIFLFITQESKSVLETTFKQQEVPTSKLRVHSADRQEMPDYISLFDWSIFFVEKKFSHKARSPVKLGEIMRMGIPVVCTSEIGDTDEIIAKYQSGLLVTLSDEVSYEVSIDRLSSTSWNGKKLSEGAAEFFGLEAGIQAYCEVYERLVTAKSSF